MGCFVFARKIRRFLVETANDRRILFFCLLDGVNLKAFYGFYFGLFGVFLGGMCISLSKPTYFPSTTDSLISFSVSLRSKSPPSATVTRSS